MIFISHKKEDQDKALAVKEFFSKKGIESWIDCLDPNLKKTGQINVTKYITTQLSKCTHMIAIFTSNTQNSYWVPFELGIAYKSDKGIGTVKWGDAKHPEYLDEFPIMKPNETDLGKFVEIYIQDRKLVKSMVMNEQMQKIASTQNADAFIQKLKRNLGN